MTILTRRCSLLPWGFPLNTRELRKGESAFDYLDLAEGTYMWKLVSTGPDSALTFCSLPCSIRDGEVSYIPVTTESVANKSQINDFGGENRNWKWVSGKER